VVAGVAVAAAALLMPRTVDVQTSSVLTGYPTQQFADLTASGFVVAQRRAAVASKGTGRLVELRVREGSLVKQGELLGRLDDSDVRAALVAAQAGVRQAEAGRRQAEAGLHQAQAEAVNAQAEVQRAEALRDQGFFAPQAVEAAQRRLQVARAVIESAQAGIASANAAQAQAQAQVGVQQVNRDNCEIRAPFDGVVLVKNANVGDMITPFSSASGTSGAVVTMADLSTLEVEADVSESNVARVKQDQPAEITLDAIPDVRFLGSVSRIVPTVDRAKATVTTKVRFNQLDPRILPEMSAKVTLLSHTATAADQQAVIAINPKAVVEREGRKVVLRLQGGSVEAVAVTLGRSLGETVEVVSGGLKSGDKLVLSPTDKVQPGVKVGVSTK
jgi:multidrug efflux pump subunit AcrA (membrane-fusion protein)